MKTTNVKRIANAHQDALAQLDLATTAVQATGMGQITPSLRNDLEDLLAVQRRLQDRLTRLARVPDEILQGAA